MKVVVVKVFGFGDCRKVMLEDIVILIGGMVIFEEKGYKLDNIELEYLGSCEKIIIDKDNIMIVNGYGNEE